jgi:hypothetical protein
VLASSMICSLALASTSAAGASVVSGSATQAQVYARSGNWAGYVVKARGGYSEVSARWTVPSAKCTGPPTDSGTWIGLGGFDTTDRLEQIGTETSCTETTKQLGPGVAYSTAFAELVPAPQTQPEHAVNPGDHVGASVKVVGSEVTLRLHDATRRWSFVERVRSRALDTTTADWVQENPGACFSAVITIGCPTGGYADFTPVTFTRASATAALTRQAGSISTRGWDAVRVACTRQRTLLAWPSLLSAGGSVFTVTRLDQRAPPESAPPA